MDQQDFLLDSPEEESNDLPYVPLKEIAQRIWLEASAMFRVLLKHHQGEAVFLFFALSGIMQAYSRMKAETVDTTSLPSLLGILIFGGAISGMLFMPVYSWCIHIVGGWMNGKASNMACRTVLAWSQTPILIRIPLLILGLMLFGKEYLKMDPIWGLNPESFLFAAFGLLDGILGVWTLVLLVRGVMVAQDFNAAKALGNIILGALLLILPIVIMVYAFISLQ